MPERELKNRLPKSEGGVSPPFSFAVITKFPIWAGDSLVGRQDHIHVSDGSGKITHWYLVPGTYSEGDFGVGEKTLEVLPEVEFPDPNVYFIDHGLKVDNTTGKVYVE